MSQKSLSFLNKIFERLIKKLINHYHPTSSLVMIKRFVSFSSSKFSQYLFKKPQAHFSSFAANASKNSTTVFAKSNIAKSLLGTFVVVGTYNLFRASIIAHCKTLEEMQNQLEQTIKEHGEESEEALKLCYEIGFYYMHRGQKDECMAAFRRYLKLIQRKFGAESGEFSHALVQVASVFTFFQNYPLAIDTLQQGLKLQKKIYGDWNKHVAQCYLNLGVVFTLMKEYEAAIVHLEKAYNLYVRLEPRDNHFLRLSLSTLANAYKTSGKKEQALKIYEALHEFNLREFGKDHPENKMVQSAIQELRNQLKPS